MSFKQNVAKFWAEFGKISDEIKADLQNQNYEAAMQKTNDKLQIAIDDPYFLVGLKDDKIDLGITPEGMKFRLFYLEYIKANKPENIDIIVTLGKPAGKFGIKMYDLSIDPSECEAYVEFKDDSFDLRLYNKNLAKLKHENENNAYNMAFILLDNTISEVVCINALGEFELVETKQKDGIKLSELYEILCEKYGEKLLFNPAQNYCAYQLEPQSDALRDDVIVGTTRLVPLINEYFDGESSIYDECKQNGIKTCFLAFLHGENPEYGLGLRGQIEDELETRTDILAHLGGATGTHRSYIDLMCFDEDELTKIVAELSQKYGVNIEICEFVKQI